VTTGLQLIYITTPSTEVARTLGRQLLEQRLAACVNILPQMHSMYWWEGKIESTDEAVLLAKTSMNKTDALIQAVEKLHPYSTPCALALDVDKGAEKYVNWLKENV
jgi:periplasmic divalent cation tolerance protein